MAKAVVVVVGKDGLGRKKKSSQKSKFCSEDSSRQQPQPRPIRRPESTVTDRRFPHTRTSRLYRT